MESINTLKRGEKMEHCQPFYEVFPEVFWYNMMTLLRHIYIVIEPLPNQLKMAYENPIPLVVDFQTKFYFKIWVLVFKYIESSDHLDFWKCDF